MKRLPSARRVQVFIVYEARCSVSKPRQRWADTPCSRLGEEEAGADGSPQQQLPGHTAGREEGRARPGGRVARSKSESIWEPTEGPTTAQACVSAAETLRGPPEESQLLSLKARWRRTVSEETRQGAGPSSSRVLIEPTSCSAVWTPGPGGTGYRV